MKTKAEAGCHVGLRPLAGGRAQRAQHIIIDELVDGHTRIQLHYDDGSSHVAEFGQTDLRYLMERLGLVSARLLRPGAR